MKKQDDLFISATPIWEHKTAYTMNRSVSFCADIAKIDKNVCLLLAASSEFLLTVNGVFAAHGPARAAHGFFYVDRYDLTPYLTKNENRIAIRVAGYNVNTFDTLDQPSFICAEIRVDGKVYAATGSGGFIAYGVGERLQKVQRYSFQRAFVETYRLTPSAFDYEYSASTDTPIASTEAAKAGVFLARTVPYGDNEKVFPIAVIHRGKVGFSEKTEYYRKREISQIGEKLLGYHEEELEYSSHIEIGKCDFSEQKTTEETAESIKLAANTYADLTFAYNTTGIFEMELTSDAPGELFILFDEILTDDEVVPFRLDISNILTVIFSKGKQRLLCAVPHTFKYARLVAKGAAVAVKGLCIHHIAYPASHIKARFVGKDADMQLIYNAAVETFCANCVDLYTDCPSRERAGWLCDGFFTGRVEPVLTGRSDVEEAFLRNFLLPKHFVHIPDGMLPMCYPADHYSGMYIPNWAMWYALELSEYCKRVGSRSFADEARPKMEAMLRFFEKYENEYGLLESLEGWVFVEWSRCNSLVQDVSFATNMLYSKMLSVLGELYHIPTLTEKSECVARTVRELSMTESGFFCDNAVRQNGKLVLSGECTETCQYYAFFCDVATPQSHSELWNTLVHSFGYDREARGLYSEIHPSNAFIGNYLRLELLCRFGLYEELYDNIKGYFTYMAERTGTLWEHTATKASCNHGFASHVIYWMKMLGLVE